MTSSHLFGFDVRIGYRGMIVAAMLWVPAPLGAPAFAQCPCQSDVGGAFGSCNPDGFCNIHDANHVFQCMVGANPCGEERCDINCDGKVDLLDASYPSCCFAGLCGLEGCGLPPVGACCYENLFGLNGCSLATEFLCTQGLSGTGATSIYLGDGTSCSPNPCDCNGNSIPDGEDITAMTSFDCNANGIPDECEDLDCNNNGITDCEDLTGGTSLDCNGNGRPDECELFGCCLPGGAQCGDATLASCNSLGGTWMGGDCLKCPEQNIGIIDEPGGDIFVHVIGPPVDCPGSGESGGPPEQGCTPGQYIDVWESPADGQMCHTFGVSGSPAIPADFFEPGSEPFSGSVCLQGVPLGATPFGTFPGADTLILRTSDPFDRCALPDPTPVNIPIEVVALSLESVSPIQVIVSGSPTLWDVAVDLSVMTPPPGSLNATKTHCNGGTYTSMLNVQPRFTFSKVGGTEQAVLDTGLEGIAPITLDQTTPAPWVHDVDPPYDANLDPCTTFHAGLEQDAIHVKQSCDCNGNNVRDRCDIEQCPPGNLACQDCNGNGFPDGCDIGSQSSLDSNGDGIPDECATVGPPIPTASEWGLAVLGLLTLTAGTLVFRGKRQRASA